MEQQNKNEVMLTIDGVETEVSHQEITHLDADIYPDGTTSLKGLGKTCSAGFAARRAKRDACYQRDARIQPL